MKNYTITVNGTAYDVTVEEKSGTGMPAAPTQAVPGIPAGAPKTAAFAAAPAANAAVAGSDGSVKVSAPMPGKILGVKAAPGQTVKKGGVIVVLEAMKMENEIVAPQDGTIVSVHVAAGDTVEAGAVLATLD